MFPQRTVESSRLEIAIPAVRTVKIIVVILSFLLFSGLARAFFYAGARSLIVSN
jgi:hypothetical protein